MLTKKLTVLHIIAVNGIGGAEKLVVQLVKEQMEIGIDVSFIFLFTRDTGSGCFELFKEVEEYTSKAYKINYKGILDTRLSKILIAKINLISPQIIHTHLKHADFFVALLKWKRRITAPVISTLHGYRDSYQNKFGLNFNSRTKYSIYYWVTKLVYKKLDGFIAVSKAVSNFYISSKLVPAEKIKVIYNGFKIDSKYSNNCLGKEFNYKLVIIGRLVKLKGHYYAIESVSRLKKAYPFLTLDIIGTGPEEQALKNLVKELHLTDKVFFKGFKRDIFNELQKYDIVLVPSIGEAFGMVFLEAFYSCKPVIAFDVPASNEIIIDGINGILVNELNSCSFSKAIQKVITNTDLRKYIITNGFDILNKEFSIEKMANSYIEYYRRVLLK